MTGGSSSGMERFEGIFSIQKNSWIGSGTTRRKVTKAVYYYAEMTEGGQVAVRPVNDKMVPKGRAEMVDLEAFVAIYKPESDIYEKQTLPAMRKVHKTLAKAERLRDQGQPYTAEYEFKNALAIDEDNIRGNFGLGLAYLELGKKEEAHEVLKKLVKLDDSFSADNKHLFNEFGIKLRKCGMFDQALSYYATAMKIAPDDENLCYNIARTLYDKEDYDTCLRYLKKAINLKPGFPEAVSMYNVISKLKAKGDI